MRLLLLLSALIAGLSGMVAGEPAAAREGERVSIAAAAVHVEQAGDLIAIRQQEAWAGPVAGEGETPATVRRFAPQFHRVDERRLE